MKFVINYNENLSYSSLIGCQCWWLVFRSATCAASRLNSAGAKSRRRGISNMPSRSTARCVSYMHQILADFVIIIVTEEKDLRINLKVRHEEAYLLW